MTFFFFCFLLSQIPALFASNCYDLVFPNKLCFFFFFSGSGIDFHFPVRSLFIAKKKKKYLAHCEPL